MAISDWPAAERPREKLMARGPEALSDAELLAIFLRTGIVGKSAVDLAREMLSTFGSLNALIAADEAAFCAVPGMGPAKYVQLQAVIEMARRALSEQLEQRDVFNSPGAVRHYLQLKLRPLRYEVFAAIFLDTQNRLLATEELFRGTLAQTSVFPREIVKRALFHNAAAVLFAHNHPSGIAEASQADQHLTQVLKQALGLIDVRVLDHFIVAADQVFSFAEHGML
ncbi:MAG: DNA repair protein RadC [Chitinivorax sp.]